MSNIRSNESSSSDDDDILPEYNLEYSKARPNRFSGVVQSGSRVVVLEPDVAEVFTTQEQVNAVLCALIATMPAQ